MENSVLKILNGIRLPSAPDSNLYVIWVLLWLILHSNLVNKTDFMLTVLPYYTLTASKLLSCSFCLTVCDSSSWLISWPVLLLCQSCCCWCIDLHTALKWFCFLHLPHLLPYAGYCIGTCPVPQYMQCSTLLHSRSPIVMFLHVMHDSIKVFGLFYVSVVFVPSVPLLYMPMSAHTSSGIINIL